MADVVVIPDDDPAPDPATAPVVVPVTVVTDAGGNDATEAAEEATETAEAAATIAFATADALAALAARVEALETSPPADAVVEIVDTAPAPEPIEDAPPASTDGDNPVDDKPKPKAKKPLKESGWFKGRK